MENQPVIIEQLLNASVADVWKAITDKDQMEHWYFDLAEFKPEVGFKFQFTGGKEGRSYLHLCQIIDVIDARRLTYSWRYDGYKGSSFVSFELLAEGDKTRLTLIHEGLESFPASNPDFAKQNFVEGWTYILGTSLPNFLKGPKAS